MEIFDGKTQWAQDIEEIIKDESVQKCLNAIGIQTGFLRQLGDIFPAGLIKMFTSYGQNWDKVADSHERNGFYRRVADFCNFKPDDLIVDVGCGGGHLLAEFARRGFRRLIGLDISPYALAETAQRLKALAPATEVHAESTVSFDPVRGFFLKGKPIMEELDFSHPQIICDDLRHLNNLTRALYLQGIKANALTYTLHGGFNANEIEFLTFIFKEFFQKEEDPFYHIRLIEGAAPKVVTSGGTLVTALRMGFLDEAGAVVKVIDKRELAEFLEEMRADYAERYGGLVTPCQIDTTDIEQERDRVEMRRRFVGGEKPEDYAGDYHCFLTKFRVSEKKGGNQDA